MLTENEQATEMLPFAIRVARKMTWDPEAESIAAIAMLKALRAYDESKGVPLKRWIAYCVKIDVYHYWRKVKVRAKVELRSEEWWEAGECLASYDDEICEAELPPILFQMLYDHYVNHWAIDVIARRYGLSIHYARLWIAEGRRQLEAL